MNPNIANLLESLTVLTYATLVMVTIMRKKLSLKSKLLWITIGATVAVILYLIFASV